jgi:hypothetical protein
MSVERSQDEGERYGISEPVRIREGICLNYQRLNLGSFCQIDGSMGWSAREPSNWERA